MESSKVTGIITRFLFRAAHASVIFLVALTCLLSCATVRLSEITITDLTQGKLRKQAGSWRVYLEDDTLDYLENGECSDGDNIRGCMWYGSVFHYETDISEIALYCLVSSENEVEKVASEQGGPLTTGASGYKLKLQPGKGRQVMANYIIAMPGGPKTHETSTACYYNDKRVVSFKTKVLIPEGDQWLVRTDNETVPLVKNGAAVSACHDSDRRLVAGGLAALFSAASSDTSAADQREEMKAASESLMRDGLSLREAGNSATVSELLPGTIVRVSAENSNCGYYPKVTVIQGDETGATGCLDDRYLVRKR